MKTAIHPTIYETKVKCACGNAFTFQGTKPEIEVEICSSCHPFFTGQMKFVDSAGRVDMFKARLKGAQENVLSKAQRREAKKLKKLEEEASRPETLAELSSKSK